MSNNAAQVTSYAQVELDAFGATYRAIFDYVEALAKASENVGAVSHLCQITNEETLRAAYRAQAEAKLALDKAIVQNARASAAHAVAIMRGARS